MYQAGRMPDTDSLGQPHRLCHVCLWNNRICLKPIREFSVDEKQNPFWATHPEIIKHMAEYLLPHVYLRTQMNVAWSGLGVGSSRGYG